MHVVIDVQIETNLNLAIVDEQKQNSFPIMPLPHEVHFMKMEGVLHVSPIPKSFSSVWSTTKALG